MQDYIIPQIAPRKGYPILTAVKPIKYNKGVQDFPKLPQGHPNKKDGPFNIVTLYIKNHKNNNILTVTGLTHARSSRDTSARTTTTPIYSTTFPVPVPVLCQTS